jgi:hypothetical protein
MSSRLIINEYLTYKWIDADGQTHRDGDLPAIIYNHGCQMWFKHGKKHRDGDLPAEVDEDGHQEWWQHGKLHRDGDLPAVVYSNGRQGWFVNGVQQTPEDRAQNRRWSALRAAFVGAVVVRTTM